MLESVLMQTFQDYEVIIVNDGSTDNTAEILQNIAHEKVRIINTENHGPAEARNIAIREAKAPVIMNLDADDKIAPQLLEKAYKIFCSNANVGIVHCDAERFGARSGKFEIGEYSPDSMLGENRINSQSLFRKEDWQQVGGYSSDLIYGLEDWDFWLLIIELGREVVKIPEKLVYYRTYKNLKDCRSGRRKQDRMKILESMVIIFHRHENHISAFPGAWKKFSKLENKFNNENIIVRFIKNQLNRYIQNYLLNSRKLLLKF